MNNIKTRRPRLVHWAIVFTSFLALYAFFFGAHSTSGANTTVYPLIAIRDSRYITFLNFFNPAQTSASLRLTLNGTDFNFSIPPYGTLTLDDTSFPNLTPGLYVGIANSSQPIDGAVQVYIQPNTLVAVYNGMAPGLGQAGPNYPLYFGPVAQHSILELVNAGSGLAATSSITVYDPTGLVVCTIPQTLQYGQAVNLDLTSLGCNNIQAVFAAIHSDQPLAGLLINPDPADWRFSLQLPQRIYPPLQPAEVVDTSYSIASARSANLLPQEFGFYISNFMVSNPGMGTTSLTRRLFDSNGTLNQQITSQLSPNASQFFTGLEQDLRYKMNSGLVVTGNQPFVFGDMTAMRTPVPGDSVVSYSARDNGGQVSLPGLKQDSMSRSIITILNKNNTLSADIQLKLYNSSGILAAQDTFTLNPMGWKSYDLGVFPSLGLPFTGSAVVTSTRSASVVVDEFYRITAACTPNVTLTRTPAGAISLNQGVTYTASVQSTEPVLYRWLLDGVEQAINYNNPNFTFNLPQGDHNIAVTVYNSCGQGTAQETLHIVCDPPKVALTQSPTGVIYPTDLIHFIGTVLSGTPPFNLSWTVDGASINNISASLDTSFAAGNHTVQFTATNACTNGADSTAHSFTVVALPPGRPDLSLSTLEAAVQPGVDYDRILFTLILRNTGQQVSSTTSYFHHIAFGLEYINGTAVVSDGSQLVYDPIAESIYWHGRVDVGSPVVITYSARVWGLSRSDGTFFTEAGVTDSNGVSTSLNNTVVYLPGYSLTINDGAVSTNNLTVNLTFTYNAARDGVQSFRISNPPAFVSWATQTDWLPLTTSPQTYTGWQLDPLGDPRSPRSVYIQFKNAVGKMFGPFPAYILYDSQSPDSPSVLSTSTSAMLLNANLTVLPKTWTIITSDDNSGVNTILVRDGATSPEIEFPATGRKTTIYWQPSQDQGVSIRVRDRAGNFSPSILYNLFNKLYLPVVLQFAR